MDLVADTKQSITCCIVEDSKKFFFSAIYGFNEGRDRMRLWTHLLAMYSSIQGEPWMMVNDFNVITDPVESFNSINIFVKNADIREFTDCCI